MPTTLTRVAYLAATAALLIWLLSGRVRTPLRGATGLAAYFTFIVLLSHA